MISPKMRTLFEEYGYDYDENTVTIDEEIYSHRNIEVLSYREVLDIQQFPNHNVISVVTQTQEKVISRQFWSDTRYSEFFIPIPKLDKIKKYLKLNKDEEIEVDEDFSFLDNVSLETKEVPKGADIFSSNVGKKKTKEEKKIIEKVVTREEIVECFVCKCSNGVPKVVIEAPVRKYPSSFTYDFTEQLYSLTEDTVKNRVNKYVKSNYKL